MNSKNHLRDHTKIQCEDHLQSLAVQSKFESSAELENTCKRLLRGFHSVQLSFLLCAASDNFEFTEIVK